MGSGSEGHVWGVGVRGMCGVWGSGACLAVSNGPGGGGGAERGQHVACLCASLLTYRPDTHAHAPVPRRSTHTHPPSPSYPRPQAFHQTMDELTSYMEENHLPQELRYKLRQFFQYKVGGSVGWLVGWSVDWSVDWLVGWSVGQLVGQLVGQPCGVA